MPSAKGREGRLKPDGRPDAAAAGPPRCVASLPSVGFWDARLVLWDPTSGWTLWSQCRTAFRAGEPHPRRRASGYQGCCGWVWGGGATWRVQPEVLLARAGGSAMGVGGAGGAGVNVCPAPAALTQFHQKLERGRGGSNSSARPERGGSRAGSSAAPPRSPVQVAGAEVGRGPAGSEHVRQPSVQCRGTQSPEPCSAGGRQSGPRSVRAWIGRCASPGY